MATEYYIVKPSKKEIFNLGKHFSYLPNIAEWAFKGKAEMSTYEYWKDIMVDLISENSAYFDYDTTTLRHVGNLAYEIFDFIIDAPVYIDADTSENCKNWEDFKEVNSIYDIWERISEDVKV